MARISLDPPRTLLNRFAAWYSRRAYGAELEPALAVGHHPRMLFGYFGFEKAVAGWKSLDPTLKALAVMAAAHRIGCSWCTDFGYWLSHNDGVDPAKLRAVPGWRTSDLFSDTERAVLAYAEAASGELTEVSDEMVTDLEQRLGRAALVELTMMIAVENQRSRFNAALGLAGQGFSDRCEVRR